MSIGGHYLLEHVTLNPRPPHLLLIVRSPSGGHRTSGDYSLYRMKCGLTHQFCVDNHSESKPMSPGVLLYLTILPFSVHHKPCLWGLK